MNLLVEIIWVVSVAGPMIAVAYFARRALYRRTTDSLADLRDLITLLFWIQPGLLIVSTSLLVKQVEAVRSHPLACYTVGSVLLFAFTSFFSVLVWRSSGISRLRVMGASIRGMLSGGFVGLIPPIYVSFYLFHFPDAFLSSHKLNLFFLTYLALHLQEYIPGAGSRIGNVRKLGECDLKRRADELAIQLGVRLEKAWILNTRLVHFGAFALGKSSIALTENLIERFRKAEVDAVVAHELGHARDRLYWRFGWYGQVFMLLFWAGTALAADRAVSNLPPVMDFLHWFTWLPLYVGLPLTKNWMSKRREGRANATMRKMATAEAVIAAEYKLALLNEASLNRPWWSRLLRTHPDVGELVKTAAKKSGLSAEDLKKIHQDAVADLEDPTDRYELPRPADRPALEPIRRVHRPSKRWSIAVSLLAAVPAFVIASAIFNGSRYPLARDGSYFLGFTIALVTGVIAYFVMCNLTLSVSMRRVRQAIAHRLESAYPAEFQKMLLVDALFHEEYAARKWQGALLGIEGDELVLLGESTEQRFSIHSNIDLTQWTCPESVTGGSNAVAIRCKEEVGTTLVVIRPFGKPPKDQPCDWDEMQDYISDLLAEAGAEHIAARETVTGRLLACLKRGCLALMVAAAAYGLMLEIFKLRGVEKEHWFSFGFLPVLFVISPVIRWIWRGSKTG